VRAFTRITGVVVATGLSGMGFQPAVADDATAIVTTVCVACHGADGNSVAPMFPKLAGQRPEYLAKQLKEFLASKRKNEIMAPMIASLKGDDVPGLAAYFSAQKPVPAGVADSKLAEAGKKIYDDGNEESGVPACVGCHQANAAGNEQFPRLAGQFQAYTLQQLADFKAGVRTNDKGKLMRVVAGRMTDDEMKAVAEYLAGLN